MQKFHDLELPTEVLEALNILSISEPTEVQKKAIPLAINGLDVLASSHTGSGKTLAYLIPLIQNIWKNPSKTKGLILVPTRELAIQVQDSLQKIIGSLRIKSTVLIGGSSMEKQLISLRKKPQIVIGTAGRIIDHLKRSSISLSFFNYLILDEMDRMLDMGMKEQLEQIYAHLPENKQVLMFSATMPDHIIDLSQKYMSNPTRVTIGISTKPSSLIKQDNLRISADKKFPALITQLNEREGAIIIFVKTKIGAEKLAVQLKAVNHKAVAIHGDLNQFKRNKVISSFRQKESRVLVATDVAARGLDIPHTKHVINYDLPMSPEDYLHRIGRAGRAGQEGFALSLISPEDNKRWAAIDRLINKGQTSPRDISIVKKKRDNFSGNIYKPKEYKDRKKDNLFQKEGKIFLYKSKNTNLGRKKLDKAVAIKEKSLVF